MIDAQSGGMSLLQCYRQHVIPHVMPLCKSQIAHTTINYIAVIESLAYFDIRIYPDLPSLGFLIQQSRVHPQAIWMMVASAVGFGILGIITLILLTRQ